MSMADDNCSDCGLAGHLHIREDGIYGCPANTPTSSSLCEGCSLPLRSHLAPNNATITCPGRCVSALQDTFSEFADSATRSGSPDPLLLAPDKQLPELHYHAFRRSAQYEDVVMPLRRSARQENQWRARDAAERHAQTPARRASSHRMAGGPIRTSRGRRTSLQDIRRSSGRSYENEAVLPAQNLPPRRKSLQPHVLSRMVPVEDMEPFEGFRPFTELDPGQLPDPVTIREPVMDLTKPPFEYAWNPSVVIPAVGGMRVRVGQFERACRPAGYTTPFTCSATADESEASSSSSCSEGYFSAQDWSSSPALEHRPSGHGMPSVDTATFPLPSLPVPSQPEFIQGSSKSIPPLQSQTLVSSPRDANSPSMRIEFPQFEELARHYAAVQGQARGIDPLPQQLTSSPCHAMEPMPSTFASASHPSQHPERSRIPCLRQISSDVAPLQDAFMTPPATPPPQPITIERSHAPATNHPRGSTTVPCTFQSGSSPSIPSRGTMELAVDAIEDWATREPWEYIHRVLTSSTCPLVVFLKMPTGDIPAAAQGALGADLRLQKMLVDNEHWLLIGPRDINLLEFGVKFQNRAHTRDKYVLRFGSLNWGADVNQIEDEVQKAATENTGRGLPAALPAQFMAGAVGGLVVWYALSLM